MFLDALGKYFATLGLNLLGLVECDDAPFGIGNHRGAADGNEERTQAGFVEPGDARPAQFAGLSLVACRAEARHLYLINDMSLRKSCPSAILARRPRDQDHSQRSASIGSRREARQAGMKPAASATLTITTVTAAKITGSSGSTLNRTLRIN